MADAAGLTLGIFRLSGIYGPGRNPLEKSPRGNGRRIRTKPGTGIHPAFNVDDMPQHWTLAVAAEQAAAYSTSPDNEPRPHAQDVWRLQPNCWTLMCTPTDSPCEADLSPLGRFFLWREQSGFPTQNQNGSGSLRYSVRTFIALA